MPFWVIYLTLCVGLMFFGRHTKHARDAALMFIGVLSMRWTNTLDFDLSLFGYQLEPVGFTSFWVWLNISATVALNGSYLVASLLGLSTIAYLPFVVLNIDITRLGVAAISSDIPLFLAIVACGNGIFGNPVRTDPRTGVTRHWRSVVGLFGGASIPESQSGISADFQKNKVTYGR